MSKKTYISPLEGTFNSFIGSVALMFMGLGVAVTCIIGGLIYGTCKLMGVL